MRPARRRVGAARFYDAPGWPVRQGGTECFACHREEKAGRPVLWGKAFPCALNKVFEQGGVLQRFVVDAK